MPISIIYSLILSFEAAIVDDYDLMIFILTDCLIMNRFVIFTVLGDDCTIGIIFIFLLRLYIFISTVILSLSFIS